MPRQRCKQPQDGHIVTQLAIAQPYPVRREHAHSHAIQLDRNSDEGDHLGRKAGALYRAQQEARILVDVLHDAGLAGGEDCARDPLTNQIPAPVRLGLGHAVGIANRCAVSCGEPVIAALAQSVDKHDASSIEPKELGQQVEHFAKNDVCGKAFGDEAHHLNEKQLLLLAPCGFNF
ncbi:hypothetical protein SDC9_94965 [bioreactor metagenome]|uniref:Uncharacterized protein n=1 Tax=bioreactor metagenome TaxID=1076179 RepID=A0A645A7H5_9ZZZZ